MSKQGCDRMCGHSLETRHCLLFVFSASSGLNRKCGLMGLQCPCLVPDPPCFCTCFESLCTSMLWGSKLEFCVQGTSSTLRVVGAIKNSGHPYCTYFLCSHAHSCHIELQFQNTNSKIKLLQFPRQ